MTDVHNDIARFVELDNWLHNKPEYINLVSKYENRILELFLGFIKYALQTSDEINKNHAGTIIIRIEKAYYHEIWSNRLIEEKVEIYSQLLKIKQYSQFNHTPLYEKIFVQKTLFAQLLQQVRIHFFSFF